MNKRDYEQAQERIKLKEVEKKKNIEKLFKSIEKPIEDENNNVKRNQRFYHFKRRKIW